MGFGDLITFLIDSDTITTIVSSISGGIVAIIGAIGAILVRKENNKRRDNCANPECCITGRKLKKKPKKTTKQAKSNETSKK